MKGDGPYKFKVGNKVVHKRNREIRGVIVGSSFGKPAAYKVRLQLDNGLIFDVTPYVLELQHG